MRGCLLALLLTGGCVTGLEKGDRAFSEQRWDDAAQAWNAVPGHDAEIAFRLAVLHATPESALYEPARASALLSRVHGQWPSSPWGRLAGLMLDAVGREAKLEARRRELESTLARETKRLARMTREAALDREADAAALDAAQEELVRLRSVVASLRAELASLETLREETETLREELEAMKLIDLRR